MVRAKFTNEQIADALRASGGVISKAAELLSESTGVSITQSAISQRVSRSKELQKIRDEYQQILVDFALYGLLQAVKDGNLTAIIFTLKCKGGLVEEKAKPGGIETVYADDGLQKAMEESVKRVWEEKDADAEHRTT